MMRAAVDGIAQAAAPQNKELCGWLSVTTLTGSITHERVDVIVTTTRPDLNLSPGGVSAAILKAAGPAIQEECKKAATSLAPGNIVTTNAGNLPASHIFHGALQQWDGREGKSMTYMREMMRRCLEGAHDRNCSSIAFPALGAGGLQVPPECCADVMHREVLRFCKRHDRSSLKDIRFVLNPSDDQVLEAFTAKYMELVPGQSDAKGAEVDVQRTVPIQVPSYWETTGQDGLRPCLVKVKRSEPHYVDIKRLLRDNGVDNSIICITRIENKHMYEEYSVRKTQIRNHAPNTDIERKLFHGTNVDAVKDININGLSRSYFESTGAKRIGSGVYFDVNPASSALPQYSPPDSNRIKYIYQCRVLTGAFCKGTPGLKAPPQIPSLPDGVRYDSVVDDEDNPAIFVIFRDSQVYPEYLIQLLDKSRRSNYRFRNLIPGKRT